MTPPPALQVSEFNRWVVYLVACHQKFTDSPAVGFSNSCIFGERETAIQWAIAQCINRLGGPTDWAIFPDQSSRERFDSQTTPLFVFKRDDFTCTVTKTEIALNLSVAGWLRDLTMKTYHQLKAQADLR